MKGRSHDLQKEMRQVKEIATPTNHLEVIIEKGMLWTTRKTGEEIGIESVIGMATETAEIETETIVGETIGIIENIGIEIGTGTGIEIVATGKIGLTVGVGHRIELKIKVHPQQPRTKLLPVCIWLEWAVKRGEQ